MADEDDINLISSDGALSMLQDLGVDPAGVEVLVLSYYLGSPALGKFSRDGYTDGWLRLGVGVELESSMEGLLAQQQAAMARVMDTFVHGGPVLPAWKAAGPPTTKSLYTAVYEYTFLFARSEGQKNLRT